MTRLDLSGNRKLGHRPEAEVFPASPRGLTSLRYLNFDLCFLRAVPEFVGSLESLETLILRGRKLERNEGEDEDERRGFSVDFPTLPKLARLGLVGCSLSSVTEAVLSSVPELEELHLGGNRLMTLPGDWGERLPAPETAPRELLQLNGRAERRPGRRDGARRAPSPGETTTCASRRSTPSPTTALACGS